MQSNAMRWTPRAEACGHLQSIRELDMHQLIYLVGLIVVILAILSFFGLR
jgi:hypothetical protein